MYNSEERLYAVSVSLIVSPDYGPDAITQAIEKEIAPNRDYIESYSISEPIPINDSAKEYQNKYYYD